jgi:sugar/nucleoside kinase (ribokinase family)
VLLKYFDVIVAGNYFLDLVFTELPAFLELGEEIYAGGFMMTPGGAFNSAAAMHRLELKVGWAGDFGNDDFSRFVLDQARAEGLDDSLFVHHNRPLRNITVAASYPADRAFLTYCDPDPAIPAALKALARANARLFYLPGFYTGPMAETGLALVRSKKMKIVVDGNAGGRIGKQSGKVGKTSVQGKEANVSAEGLKEEALLQNPSIENILQRIDLYMPNALEARRMTGESCLEQALLVLASLCPLVVVKDGPNGAWAIQNGVIIHSPAIPVKVTDTTGAGDCFNAGFLRAWLDGRPLPECLRWGNISGGFSTTASGGTGRVVRLLDTLERL